MKHPISYLVISALSACSETGQDLVTYEAVGRGVGTTEVSLGAWAVALDVADMAIGPAYFCATQAASADLCQTAVNELTTVATIDLLDDSDQSLGVVQGVTGAIGSVTYDHGITWSPTESNPAVKPGAANGHSLRIGGTAMRGADSLTFIAEVDLRPQRRGGHVVDGRPVAAEILDDQQRLVIAADPSRLIAKLDFDQAFSAGEDPWIIVPGSSGYESIVLATTVNAPPTFTFEPED